MAEEQQSTNQSPGVVFRQAPPTLTPEEVRQEKVDGQGLQTPEMKEEVKTPVKTPPLSLYQQVKGRPYSADYFGLAGEWQFRNYPQEIETIENFVDGEIKKAGLQNTVDSYNEIVEALEQKIGKRDNERIWHRMDRIVAYIKTIENVNKWRDRKMKLEGVYG